MITYGSTTLTSYNSIVRTEVYYYKSTSATSLSGGSWSTTKPTWENGKYIWQKIRTVYEDGTHTESDPVNITGQQGATGTAAYSYKLNSSDSIIGKTKDGEYTIKKITFSATYKQGTGAVSAYSGRFKIESTTNGSTWKTEYTSSGNESSKEFTIPDDIIAIKCSLYQSDGTTVLLDIITVPVVKDGVDAIGLRDSIPYYLASDKDTGITRLTQGWTRYRPQLTAEKKYLWVYYVSRYSEGTTEPELIEIKDDLVHFVNNGDEAPVESCVVDIEPVQDLHGYDSPWPAGGGANTLDPESLIEQYPSPAYGLAISRSGEWITINGTYSSEIQTPQFRFMQKKDGSTFDDTYWAFPDSNSSNNIPGWTKKVDSNKTLTIGLSNMIQGTTYNIRFRLMGVMDTTRPTDWTPYENICPISGFTGVKVTRTGKNLLNLSEWETESSSGITIGTDNINIIHKGYQETLNHYNVLNQSACVFSFHVKTVALTDSRASFAVYADGTTKLSGSGTARNGNIMLDSVGTEKDIIINVPNGTEYISFGGWAWGGEVQISNLQLELGSTATDYEPYTGHTYPITFPTEAGTVYGGTLDVTKGVLTVDRVYALLNDPDKWIASAGTTADFDYAERFASRKKYDNSYYGLVCSYMVVNSAGQNSLTARWTGAASNTFGLRWASGSLDQVKADAQANKIAIVYELATPITYQLTQQEITSLLGTNNVWADTGQTAISYYDNQTSTDPYVDYSLTSAFDASTIEPAYIETEWVESTGKQYVYLDWKPPIKTWGFEIDFISYNALGTTVGAWNEDTNKNGYGTIFGVRNASGVNNAQLSSYSNGVLRIGNGANQTTGFKTNHTRQQIKLQNTTITKTDGTTSTVSRLDETANKPYCNMTVFGLHDGLRRAGNGGISEPSSTRIYSLKFYDGDTLTVDLVGAIRKRDSVTGLYDKVSKHFYPAPGMLFGDVIGDIGDSISMKEAMDKANPQTIVVNKDRTRMWEATVPFNDLQDGQKITVTYSYGNIVSSVETDELIGWDDTSNNQQVYLKLTFADGHKTDWIPCYYSNTSRLTTHYGAGIPIQLTYRENILANASETASGNMVLRGFYADANYDSNNTDIVRWSYGRVIAGSNKIFPYSIIMQNEDERWESIVTSSTTAKTKTRNTHGFRLDTILYQAANTTTNENAENTSYQLRTGDPIMDMRYNLNIEDTNELRLVHGKSVYLVGTVGTDGLFYLADQWWSQSLPTTEDGKIYIFLGQVYDWYRCGLATMHPIYKFVDGKLKSTLQIAVDALDKAKEVAQDLADLGADLQAQIDGKVETWCQKSNPATNWSAEERPNHTGDLWYYIGESTSTYKNNTTYQYNGNTNTWTAYSANPDLFDKIDGKTTIYYGTQSSVTSAEEGDYLVDSTDGSSYRWNNGAWVKVTDYKTAIDNIEIGGRNLFVTTSRFHKEENAFITESNKKDNFIYNFNNGSIYTSEPFYEGETIILQAKSNLPWNTRHATDGTAPNTVGFWLQAYDTKEDAIALTNLRHSQFLNGENTTSFKKIWTIPASDNGKYYTFRFNSYGDGTNITTAKFWDLKLERGNKPTDWTPAPEDTENSIKAYTESIQSQVDGMAEIHYGTVVPTLSNAPYTSWTDTATRDMHVDDLYYNTSTGYCYRFIKSNSTYSWTRIKDSDITAAATAASNANTAAGNAQTTANNANTLAGQKRRIFVAQPTPPYEVGDLWVEGSNGDIKKCKTARATGSYTASDWELASKYTDDTKANIINNAIISRGEQLVINGNGMMGNNYNFSSLIFDGSKSNGSPGSFTRTAETSSYTITSNEFFPITPSKTYLFSFDAMTLNNLSTMYAFIDFYDVDKLQIRDGNHMYRPNTLTTLKQELKNGDTVVYLNNISNWETSGNYKDGFIFWNYTNSFGYQYPEQTYSRYKWGGLFDLNNINKTNNTITLKAPWNYGTFPAGTKLSQCHAGGNYKYLGISGAKVPNVWTSYKGRIGDIDYSGNNLMNMFPPGTAYAKVGFLWNYNKANDQIWVTNISVKEDVTRGTGFYSITTTPTVYTTTTGGFTPAYRIALSTVKTESGLEEVMVGDVIQQGYNTYPVGYVDTSYVYLGTVNSIRGATGATGLNNAQVILYRRFASAPSGTNVAPTGDVTYTFATGKAVNNLNSWTQNIPSGSDPVYMIAASASSTSSTDTIPKTEWSAPVKILENGQDGGTGSAGADGYNQATIFLYQRKSGTAPSKPSSAVTYTFSSGALSSTPTGWSRTIPTNNGNPCYVTTATAVAKTATYSIPVNGWSDVVILSQDGEKGTSITITSTSVKYQKGTSGTTKPTGTWGTSIPTIGENEYLWTQTIVNYSDNSKTESYSVSRNAKNGTNGTSPTVSSTTVEYQQSTGGTTPPTGTWATSAPTATAGQYMWTRTTVKYSDNKTAVSYSVSKNGTNGTSPTAYHLIVSHGAINKSQAGVYNPTTITLTSKSQTGNGALNNYNGRFKIETTTDNSTWTQDSASSTADESSKTYTIPANIKAVRFSLYLAGGFTTLLDQQTVPIVIDGAKGDSGDDAYTIVLTNEAHTFPAGVSAALAGSATSSVMTYKGGTQVACFVGSTSSATSISTGTTGLTCAINNNNSKNVSLTFTTTTSLTTKAGTVTIPITVDNKSFSKTFTWSLANQGAKGDNGVSVTNVTSTNNTADGGTNVVTITLSDGTTKTFNVKNGTKGNTGATAQWYYGTSLTHTSGTATLVATSTSGAVIGSMYLNTQTSLVYKCTAVGTNNTWTYAGDLTTGVIDNIEIGGRNLLCNSNQSLTTVSSKGDFYLSETIPADTTIVVSVQIDADDITWASSGNRRMGFEMSQATDGVASGTQYAGTWWSYPKTTFHGRIWSKVKLTQDFPAIIKRFGLYVQGVTGGTYKVSKPKVEIATKPTDWTPAPEDIDASISTAQSTADEALAATQPISSKTFTDIIGTANDLANASFYFAKVHPTTYTDPWMVKMKIKASVPSDTNFRKTVDITIHGCRSNFISYDSIVANYNSNPIYYLNLYRATQAGIETNKKGHALGFGLRSATSPTDTNKKRTFEVDLLEVDGCTVDWIDTPVKYADMDGTGSTNYVGCTELGITSNGQNATNNDNTYDRIKYSTIKAAEAIARYNIIVGTSAGYKHLKSGTPWDITYPILYADAALNANATGSSNYLTIPFTVTTTQNMTLTPYKPVYIEGTLDGITFTPIDTTPLTQTVPTSDNGHQYILLGSAYSTTAINLEAEHPIYQFQNGNFVTVAEAASRIGANAENLVKATYAVCSTAAGANAKTADCTNFELYEGARIQVTFTNANTASAPTLNINNTGAKAIYINKTAASNTNQLLWTAGSKMEFVYDGTGWIAQNVPYALYGTCSTGASTAAKAVTCNEAVICKGTTISVNMTNTNTAANATMNVGSTVAKDIYANGAKLTTNSRFNWRANTTQKFVFDGQVWRMDDDSVKALATAYITEIDDDGIMVHPEDDDTSGWAISDAIQLFKNGISYIKLWIENNIPKIRIGKEDQGHIILDNDSVDIRNDNKVLASFGATSVIGDENDWHQTIAANQITFAKGDDIITYISPDKLYTINAEVADAFYISNYSIRNASDGKLVIGLRR